MGFGSGLLFGIIVGIVLGFIILTFLSPALSKYFEKRR